MAKVPIDTGWAWCTVVGAGINIFFVIGGMKSMGVLFVYMIESFGATPALLGWMLGLMSFGLSVFSPFVTAFGTYYSYRAVVIVGGIIMSAAFMLASLSTNVYYIVCVLGVLVGLANGCLFTPSFIMVGQYFVKYRSISIGLVMAGGSLGQLVLPLFMQLLLDNLSFFGCMLVYSALVSHSVLAGLLLRPQDFYTRGTVKIVEPSDLTDSVMLSQDGLHTLSSKLKKDTRYLSNLSLTVTPAHSVSSLNSMKPSGNYLATPVMHHRSPLASSTGNLDHSLTPILHTRHPQNINRDHNLQVPQKHCVGPKCVDADSKTTADQKSESTCATICKSVVNVFERPLLTSYVFWTYVFAVCMATGGYFDQFLYIPSYGQEIGLDKYDVTWVLALAGIMDILGRIIGGVVNNFQLIRTGTFCALSLLLASVGISVCLLIPGKISMLVHAAVLGFLGGMYIALYPVALVDLLGLEVYPKAFSLTVMATGVVTLILPLSFGPIASTVGSYSPVFWICVAMMALGGVLFFLEPFAGKLDRRRKGGPDNIYPEEQKENLDPTVEITLDVDSPHV